MSDRLLPGIQPSGDKKRNPWPWILVAGCVVIGAISAGYAITAGGDDEYQSNTSYEAIAQCEAAIEERLKAPATADFNSTATGDGTWTVIGTVDAENGFGAMIRSSYQCSVIIDEEEDTARVRVDSFE